MVKIEHYTVLRRQRRIVNGLLQVDFESILSTDSTSRSLDRFDRPTRLESTLSIDSTSALIDRHDRFQGLTSTLTIKNTN